MSDEYKDMPESIRLANEKADALMKELSQPQAEVESNLVTFDDDELSEELESDTEALIDTADDIDTGEEEHIEQDTLESEEVDDKLSYEDLEELYRKADARYRSIQGKYNKEGQIDREEIAYLKAQLAERPVMDATSVQHEEVEKDDFSYLSDTEKEAYDPDYLATMEKIAKNAAKGNANELARLKQARQDEEYTQRQAQINTNFDNDLTALAPNWSEIHEDPLFQEWLDYTDLPIVGNARQALYGFDGQNDARAVAEIFNSYAPLNKSTAKKGLKVSQAELSPPKAISSKAISSKPAKNVYTRKFRTEFLKNYTTGQSMMYKGKKLDKEDMDFVYKDMEAQMLSGQVQ